MKIAVSNYRMRALVGRERDITENENAYGDKTPLEKFENIFNKAIRDEFYRHYILLKLNQSPKSVKDLAKEIEIDPSEVLDHLLILKGRGQVDMENIIGITPIYINLMEG
ncbi:MAG: ArsR family transcriptional regulator [Promethearchaeota archaeon]